MNNVVLLKILRGAILGIGCIILFTSFLVFFITMPYLQYPELMPAWYLPTLLFEFLGGMFLITLSRLMYWKAKATELTKKLADAKISLFVATDHS